MREKRQDPRPVIIVVRPIRVPGDSHWLAHAYIGDQLPESARSSSAMGAIEKLATRLRWL